MFKKKIELIKPITYPDGTELAGQFQLGSDNRLYRSLIRLFEAFWIYNKKELYLVGGCVRDMLLGKTPKDYDLCTNATPDEVKEISKALGLKTFDSGIKHGTLTVIDDFHGQSYEVTTYRVDGKYSDGRHPDEVVFTPSLEEDLKRRDFTINSFAYDMLRQELLALDESYFKDLEYGMIRTVGKAEDRFTEDALRMLRAFRFMAQLGFSIDADTFEAIKKVNHLIVNVSKERIRDELTKILLSDNPQVLELFIISGLEPYCISGPVDENGCILTITPMTDILRCQHDNPWHYTDVFHHTMDVIKRAPKNFESRWAALFHDFGKPATKQLKEGTTNHYNYHGHPDVSAVIAGYVMEILKFSNEQKYLIDKYVKYHDLDLVSCKNATFKRVLNEIGVDKFTDFIKLKQADALAHQISRDTKWAIDTITKLYARYDKVITESQALTVRDLDIDGYDLMELGFQGKAIGDCLNSLLEAVLEDADLNKKEKLIEMALQSKADNV